ncbi:MAG: hypothetical protein JKY65_15160 [Planctomycetes bacterium]|nr:hypothetical protein [Planctomycetota bacterium]
MKVFLFAVVAALLFGPLACAQDKVVHKLDYDVSGLNQGLVANRLTCDLQFHLTKDGNVTWETVVERLPKLREIFEPAGIQFRVASARLIEIPDAWHTHTPKRGDPPSNERTWFYPTPADMKPLAPATERVFKAVIGDKGPGAELSVHFISLRSVQTGWWERDSDGKWRYETAATGACSFPPYLFGKNMPARVRGVITLSSKRLSSRTFAHELGHKLINVSHEGVGKAPKGEQWGGDDLMIYGNGTRIPSGAKGRFQVERLKRSPFLYRTVAGKRQFNPPYREGGHYWDPVYRISADRALWAETRPKRTPRKSQGLKGALDSQAGPR